MTKRPEWQIQLEANKIRNELAEFVFATRPIEVRDPEIAASRYRDALARLNDADNHTINNGLPKTWGWAGHAPTGYFEPMDRLTLLLQRLERFEELIVLVDGFFSEYPGNDKPNNGFRKRQQASRNCLAGKQVAARKPLARPTQSAINEQQFARLLKNGRRSDVFGHWTTAIAACKAAGDWEREYEVHNELIGRMRERGQSPQNLLQRFYELEALMLEVGPAPSTPAAKPVIAAEMPPARPSKRHEVKLWDEKEYPAAAAACQIGEQVELYRERGKRGDPDAIAAVAALAGRIGYVSSDSFLITAVHAENQAVSAWVASKWTDRHGNTRIRIEVELLGRGSGPVPERKYSKSGQPDP